LESFTFASRSARGNSRLAKVLKDKGYAYQFVYSKGAGHTQRKVIDDTLPQALEYVWLDYTPHR
jgi:hypothetical protein